MSDQPSAATGKMQWAPGCALWLAWTVATGVGWTLGCPILDAILGAVRRIGRDWLGADGSVVAEVVIYTLLGTLPGILQSILLWFYLPRAGHWALASALSGALVGAAASMVPVVDVAVGLLVAGAWFGILQWLVLRRHAASAWWWLLASPVGWAAGYLAGRAADGVVSSLPLSETLGLALLFGVFGTVYGAITGVVIAWLMQHPIPGATSIVPELSR